MFLKKLHRRIFGPQLGDKYKPIDSTIVDQHIRQVKIIDRRDTWVKILHIGDDSYRIEDWNILAFMRQWEICSSQK